MMGRGARWCFWNSPTFSSCKAFMPMTSITQNLDSWQWYGKKMEQYQRTTTDLRKTLSNFHAKNVFFLFYWWIYWLQIKTRTFKSRGKNWFQSRSKQFLVGHGQILAYCKSVADVCPKMHIEYKQILPLPFSAIHLGVGGTYASHDDHVWRKPR